MALEGSEPRSACPISLRNAKFDANQNAIFFKTLGKTYHFAGRLEGLEITNLQP